MGIHYYQFSNHIEKKPYLCTRNPRNHVMVIKKSDLTCMKMEFQNDISKKLCK